MRAQQAKQLLEQSRQLGGVDGQEQLAFTTWAGALDLAWQEGRHLALASDQPQTPPEIAQEPDLMTAFMDGVSRGRRERAQTQQGNAQAQGSRQGDAAPQASTPSPETMAAQLLAGQHISVLDHSLCYKDGVTWYTNPYGVDGIVAMAEPSPALMAEFLQRVQRSDGALGLVPN